MGHLVFVGTYTSIRPKDRAPSEGIHAYRYDAKRGTLAALGVTRSIDNPSFLAVHPDGTRLYSVIEVENYEGEKTGALAAFAIERKTGALKEINRQISHGAAPCHITCDPKGAFVFVANYSGGSMAVYPVEKGGRLGPAGDVRPFAGRSVNEKRQTASHAHSVAVDAAGRFVFCQDLGTDKVWQFRLDRDRGRLEPNKPDAFAAPAGSGPRHFAFHPNGRFAYLIGELGSVVTACAYDAEHGTLSEIHTVSTLPKSHDGWNSCADIHVAPSGRFLYGSNRGHDSIAIFRIDAASGRLAPAGHEPTGGKHPRNFALSPDGRFLFAANQNSHNVVAFAVDAETGGLEHTGEITHVSAPVCVRFVEV